jgi:hypothetical protein
MIEVSVGVGTNEVAAAPGERVVLHLEELASSGYEWQVSGGPEHLEVVDSELEASDGRAPGAAATRTIALVVAEDASGDLVLDLAMVRPWTSEEPAARRARLLVHVR